MPKYHFAIWDQANYEDDDSGEPLDFDTFEFDTSLEDHEPESLTRVLEDNLKPLLRQSALVPTEHSAVVLVISPVSSGVRATLRQLIPNLNPDLLEDDED